MRILKVTAGVVAVVLLMVALPFAQQAPPARGTPGPNEGNSKSPSDLGAGPWEFKLADYQIKVSKMVSTLDRPHGMTFLPDGAILITERPGRLRIVRDGILDPTPIAGMPKVVYKDFDGLEDVVLHPNFAQTRVLYLSYSGEATGGKAGAARRCRAWRRARH